MEVCRRLVGAPAGRAIWEGDLPGDVNDYLRRLIWGVVLALAALITAPSSAAPLVQTSAGALSGLDMPDGSALFLGVPYAAPPVGPLRWQVPRLAPAWQGVKLATQDPPSCPQSNYGAWNAADAARGQEDCLYLDIRTPRLDPTARLPVLVWIHGGGNRGGSMRGAPLSVIAGKGIVFVSLQYRLAALGFLAHPALGAEGLFSNASGNYGLMDQVAALKWVQANIARFGGDPANVTIAGQSAGAQDVGLLNLTESLRGFYARAIEESGTADFGLAPLTLAQAEAVGQAVARQAGAPPNATAAQLRALPVQALLAAADQVKLPPVGLHDASFIWLAPVVDGIFMTRSPAAIMAEANQEPIPLLIGVNAREIGLGWPSAQAAMQASFGDATPHALRLYGLDGPTPPPADPLLGDSQMQVSTDVVFRCPTVNVAASQARTGAPVWMYQYERTPASGVLSHSSELASVFGGSPVSPPGAAAPYSLADYWAAFVRTGDPNGAGRPHWSRQTPQARPYMAFTDHGPVHGHDLRAAICKLNPRF